MLHLVASATLDQSTKKSVNKSKMSLTSELFNPFPSEKAKTPKKQVAKIQSPDRINLHSPQINKLFYNKVDAQKRSKILQVACESPDILNLFHKRKLFVNGENNNSAFVTKTVTVVHSKDKNKDSSLNFIKSSFKESSGKQRDYSTSEIREALIRLKTPEKSKKKFEFKNDSKKNVMCSFLKNIVKKCEHLKKDSNEKFDSSMEREQKMVKNATDRMQWTTSKLEKWADYEEPVLKELFDQEYFTKLREASDNLDLTRDLANKSHSEIRSQARLIKKVLYRNKLKLL